MEKIIPISDLQTKAKLFVDQVKKTGEPVIITQRGRVAAVLVNYENYEGQLATLEEMNFPDWKDRLATAKKESGKGISWDTYLKRKQKRAKKS